MPNSELQLQPPGCEAMTPSPDLVIHRPRVRKKRLLAAYLLGVMQTLASSVRFRLALQLHKHVFESQHTQVLFSFAFRLLFLIEAISE